MSFTLDHDIDSMRKHEGYEEVTREPVAQKVAEAPKPAVVEADMPKRHNGKVDKRSLAYRKMTGRS